uniref:Uncharacterized protein LOC110217725 isoform X2 n=1 Tax=Phascolarctos cinereus TaxID=38626 RepID=A0A6P5LGT1_PHACI|nr:uncharacterized protein LOC110217725 isoform X2 [Phascolarctos cinereus]
MSLVSMSLVEIMAVKFARMVSQMDSGVMTMMTDHSLSLTKKYQPLSQRIRQMAKIEGDSGMELHLKPNQEENEKL